MKKASLLLIALFAIFTVFFHVEKAEASGWATLGYSYTVTDDKSQENNLYGPLSITLGGDFLKILAFEVAFAGRWNYNWFNPAKLRFKENLMSFDITPYLLVQPSFGPNLAKFKPYIGIGVPFSFAGDKNSKEFFSNLDEFGVGFAAKAGLRVQLVKFLLIGVGFEYIYQKMDINKINEDFSGWRIGAEAGIIF